jgi:hypothetical protein
MRHPWVVEIQMDGEWVDVTGDVLVRDPVTITRGRQDESARVAPSQCTFTLRNIDGKYTLRNPSSPYYGKLSREAPVRVRFPGVIADGTSTSPSASIVAPSVTAPESSLLVCMWLGSDGNVQSFDFTLPGSMTGGSEVDGAFSSSVVATEAISSGATGTRTATASPAPDNAIHSLTLALEGSYVVEEQLSDGGLNSDVTLTTDVGTQAGWWLLALQGWDFTAVTQPPPAPGDEWVLVGETAGKQGFLRAWVKVAGGGAEQVGFGSAAGADTHAHLLVLSGGPTVLLAESAATRFTGRISSAAPSWDVSENDTIVRVTASGLMRRWERGEELAQSSFRTQALDVANAGVTVGYWPLEDGSDATQAASALPGLGPMQVTGSARFGSDSTSFPGSAPLPTISDTTIFFGRVPSHPGTGSIAFRGLFVFPEDGLTDGVHLVHIWQSTSQVFRWQLVYKTGGALDLVAIAPGGATLDTAGVAMGVDGKAMMLGFTLIQDGSDVDWHIFGRHVVDGVVVQGGLDGTFSGLTVDTTKRVYVFGQSGMTLGHVLVGTDVSLASNIDEGMTGYSGETAAGRIERLATEGGIPYVIIGDADESTMCGTQRLASRPELLTDAADADAGILYEPRDAWGIAYRTRASQYNQEPVALSYADGEVALQPVPDDQYTANDITASRLAGSSYRAVQEEGPLNINEPEDDPDGVGRAPSAITVNVVDDSMLSDAAHWALRLGTVDEHRYPIITVTHTRLTTVDGKHGLSAQVADLDIGDRLVVTDPPDLMPPGDIDQLVQGYTETLLPYLWVQDFNCTPASPYAVAEVYDEDNTHGYDLRVAGGTDMVLAADVDTDDTELLVVSLSGTQRWVTVDDDAESAGDFPHDALIGGERVTVTASDLPFDDSFARTVSNGFGTPDSSLPGTAYTVEGAASAYSVVGGTTGRIATGTTNTLYLAHADMGSSDGEIRMRTTVPVLPTGAAITVRVNGRVTDASNYYEAQLTFNTSGAVSVAMFKRVGGSGSVLASGGSSVTLNSTHSAGNSWWLAFRYVGSSLAAKGWKDGEAEPPIWQTTGVDTSLTSGTRIGVSCRRETGNTDGSQDIDFDDLIATAPQVLTVARSVNGVSKSYSAGAVVEDFEPAYVAR